jgi:hypothetical protein
MNLYVAPGGAGDGSSPAKPLGSVQTACNLAAFGDTIYLAGGTYNEQVIPTTSGVANFPIKIRPLDASPQRLLDGTGNAQTLLFRGPVAYWDVSDLDLTNRGGDGSMFVNGLAFQGSTSGADSLGCHDITIARMNIFAVNRTPTPNHYANPVSYYSTANTSLTGTSIRNIQLDTVVIYDCDIHDFPASGAFEGPLLAIAGAVEDWILKNCTFDPNRSTHYGDGFGINHIEDGGPVGSNPPYPIKGVIQACEFIGGQGAIGLFRAGRTLILGNTFTGCGTVAMQPNAEGVSADPVGAQTWWIGNHTINCGVGFATGPWDANFFGAKDVYVTANIFETTALQVVLASATVMFNAATATPCVTGDSLFSCNVVKAPNQLLWIPPSAGSTMNLQRNSYLTDNPAAFYNGAWVDFPYSTYLDQTSTKYPYATPIASLPRWIVDVPSWYQPGVTFGVYEPKVYVNAAGDRVLRTGFSG